ncbi:MAG TPA: hypothetical protein VJY39_20480 [Acidisphaera sp.]|nr:hypothetical protein [Acidisphaera sp.]
MPIDRPRRIFRSSSRRGRPRAMVLALLIGTAMGVAAIVAATLA